MVKGILLHTFRMILAEAADDVQQGAKCHWKRNTPTTRPGIGPVKLGRVNYCLVFLGLTHLNAHMQLWRKKMH